MLLFAVIAGAFVSLFLFFSLNTLSSESKLILGVLGFLSYGIGSIIGLITGHYVWGIALLIVSAIYFTVAYRTFIYDV